MCAETQTQITSTVNTKIDASTCVGAQTTKRDLEQRKIQLEIYKLVLRILLLVMLGALVAVNNIPAEEVLGLL